MNDIGLANSIGIIIIFIALFLSFFLFNLKTGKRLANRLFGFLLLLIAFDISGWTFPLYFDTNSNFTLFRSNLIFLQLPVFYLHVLSVCYVDFKLKSKHLLHSIPFIIANAILIPRYYLVSAEAKMLFLQHGKSMWEVQFFHVFIHIQVAVYLIVIFLFLKKVRTIYRENYTDSDTNNYSWLFKITIFFSLFHGLALFKNIFKFSKYQEIGEWIKIALGVLELGILCWYLLEALQHPQLFRSVDPKLQLVDHLVPDNRPDTYVLTKEDQETVSRLKTYMVEEEPFLDASLTVKKLADHIKIPVRELSILINHTLGQHFFDFVNEYRIEKAMKILKNPLKKKYTVLEILYEVGFNSKSSFNTAFKKHTGHTPAAYRKNHDNQ